MRSWPVECTVTNAQFIILLLYAVCKCSLPLHMHKPQRHQRLKQGDETWCESQGNNTLVCKCVTMYYCFACQAPHVYIGLEHFLNAQGIVLLILVIGNQGKFSGQFSCYSLTGLCVCYIYTIVIALCLNHAQTEDRELQKIGSVSSLTQFV